MKKKASLNGIGVLLLFGIWSSLVLILSGNEKTVLAAEVPAYVEVTDINYNESADFVNNPERGWYDVQHVNLKVSENGEVKLHKPGSSFQVVAEDYSLVHLLVDLSAFSGKYNEAQDLELTEEALTTLASYLAQIKAANKTAIVRFAYDKDFAGKTENYNKEPAMEMILKHMEQVGGVLNTYAETVSCVECGIFGPWGEMHSCDLISSADKEARKKNLSLVIDKWLDVLDESITVSVRQPEYYAIWAGVPISEIDQDITTKEQRAYRVGIYNDGYLGSKSDLGTFRDREKEVTWLSNQAKHTLYGGEVCAWQGEAPAGNTVTDIAKEGFETHTSYLNWAWNYDVIKSWKEQEYQGQNGLNYVSNHLGYRFVLKNAQITSSVEQGQNLGVRLLIDNVGFGNMVKPKKATIVLENEAGEVAEYPVDVDVTTWDSQKETDVTISLPIATDAQLGKYTVYLRISQAGNLETDENYLCVRFANESYEEKPIYAETIGGNYIGSFSVIEQPKTKDTDKDDTEKKDSEDGKSEEDAVGNDPQKTPDGDTGRDDASKDNTSKDNTGDTDKESVQKITVKAYRPKSVKIQKGKLVVKTKALGKKADGYQIQYAYNSHYKKAKSKNIKANKAKTTTIRLNQKKKVCYVRVRTYKVKKTGNKQKKYYSKWISYRKERL